MILVVRLSPRAFKAGEHLALPEQLAAGRCARCPGKWHVRSSVERERIGMIRVFHFELDPLDANARITDQNQML